MSIKGIVIALVFALAALTVSCTQTPSPEDQNVSAEENKTTIIIGEFTFDTDEMLIEVKDAGLTAADIQQLSYANEAVILSLDSNRIDDISVLAGLANLTSLSVSYNKITDIEPLAGLTGLTWLHLGNNLIEDISVLQGMNELESLIIFENQIKDISPLRNLTSLERLDLRSNMIEDISVLFGLTNLSYLNLSGNPVSKKDLSELEAVLVNCSITGTEADLP